MELIFASLDFQRFYDKIIHPTKYENKYSP